MKFRKKPVEVEAWQIQDLKNDQTLVFPLWVMQAVIRGTLLEDPEGGVLIKTLEGVMHGKIGDWLVQGSIKKELWAVDREIFEATYERVDA